MSVSNRSYTSSRHSSRGNRTRARYQEDGEDDLRRYASSKIFREESQRSVADTESLDLGFIRRNKNMETENLYAIVAVVITCFSVSRLEDLALSDFLNLDYDSSLMTIGHEEHQCELAFNVMYAVIMMLIVAFGMWSIIFTLVIYWRGRTILSTGFNSRRFEEFDLFWEKSNKMRVRSRKAGLLIVPFYLISFCTHYKLWCEDWGIGTGVMLLVVLLFILFLKLLWPYLRFRSSSGQFTGADDNSLKRSSDKKQVRGSAEGVPRRSTHYDIRDSERNLVGSIVNDTDDEVVIQRMKKRPNRARQSVELNIDQKALMAMGDTGAGPALSNIMENEMHNPGYMNRSKKNLYSTRIDKTMRNRPFEGGHGGRKRRQDLDRQSVEINANKVDLGRRGSFEFSIEEDQHNAAPKNRLLRVEDGELYNSRRSLKEENRKLENRTFRRGELTPDMESMEDDRVSSISRRSKSTKSRTLNSSSKPTEIMDRPNSVDYLPSIPEIRSGRRRASPTQRYNESFPGRREKNSDRVGRDYDKEANFSTGGVGSLTASRGSMHNFAGLRIGVPTEVRSGRVYEEQKEGFRKSQRAGNVFDSATSDGLPDLTIEYTKTDARNSQLSGFSSQEYESTTMRQALGVDFSERNPSSISIPTHRQSIRIKNVERSTRLSEKKILTESNQVIAIDFPPDKKDEQTQLDTEKVEQPVGTQAHIRRRTRSRISYDFSNAGPSGSLNEPDNSSYRDWHENAFKQEVGKSRMSENTLVDHPNPSVEEKGTGYISRIHDMKKKYSSKRQAMRSQPGSAIANILQLKEEEKSKSIGGVRPQAANYTLKSSPKKTGKQSPVKPFGGALIRSHSASIVILSQQNLHASSSSDPLQPKIELQTSSKSHKEGTNVSIESTSSLEEDSQTAPRGIPDNAEPETPVTVFSSTDFESSNPGTVRESSFSITNTIDFSSSSEELELEDQPGSQPFMRYNSEQERVTGGKNSRSKAQRGSPREQKLSSREAARKKYRKDGSATKKTKKKKGFSPNKFERRLRSDPRVKSIVDMTSKLTPLVEVPNLELSLTTSTRDDPYNSSRLSSIAGEKGSNKTSERRSSRTDERVKYQSTYEEVKAP